MLTGIGPPIAAVSLSFTRAECQPEAALTSRRSLVTVAAHARCESLVAALSAPPADRYRLFDVGIGSGGPWRARSAYQVAAGWSVHLLSPRRRFSGGQRAWRSLREPSPAFFPGYPTLPVAGPDPSLEVATSRAAVAECRGLGWHPGRHRSPCADGPALIGN